MINSRSLAELLPSVRAMAVQFIAVAEMELEEKLNKRVKVKVTSTYRDDEAQEALYAEGRTQPGTIKTNARAGDSWHNYRCAFDVALEIDGKITWERELYLMLGVIGKRVGLTWGGDWDGDGQQDKNDWDLVHFQYTGGATLAELKAGRSIA